MPVCRALIPSPPRDMMQVAVAEVQWVQCDACQKWRRVPDTVNSKAFPEHWSVGVEEWGYGSRQGLKCSLS
jgi:hypothetical protein